jgi:hypothetical protein
MIFASSTFDTNSRNREITVSAGTTAGAGATADFLAQVVLL